MTTDHAAFEPPHTECPTASRDPAGPAAPAWRS